MTVGGRRRAAGSTIVLVALCFVARRSDSEARVVTIDVVPAGARRRLHVFVAAVKWGGLTS